MLTIAAARCVVFQPLQPVGTIAGVDLLKAEARKEGDILPACLKLKGCQQLSQGVVPITERDGLAPDLLDRHHIVVIGIQIRKDVRQPMPVEAGPQEGARPTFETGPATAHQPLPAT